MFLPHLASRLYGTPLLIAPPKLEVILAVLGERIGLPHAAIGNLPVPSQKPEPVSPSGGIAVIPIYGTLVRRTAGLEADSGLTSYQSLAAMLDAAVAAPEISGILLDIDSPGGEAGGVFDLADRIRAACKKKKVYAVANDHAYSAAYALASSAERVFLTRTGGVGSIGVIAMHVDQSVRDAQAGYCYTTVFAGARKNDLNPHEPISDAGLAFLQAEINRIYGLFTNTVARNRNMTLETVTATEAGLFFAQDAVSAGLADAVGTFDDALTALAEAMTPRLLFPISAGASSRSVSATLSTPTPKEKLLMEDPTPDPVPDRAADSAEDAPAPRREPVAVATVNAAGHLPVPGLTLADAQEIAELCQLAGCPERIAGYLANGTPTASVRRELLSLQASGTEVTSRLVPEPSFAKPESLSDNPLIRAALKKAGKEN